MKDYIAVLLDGMEGHWVDLMDASYFLERDRAEQAEQELLGTLSESQLELFLSYEERRNAVVVLGEDVMLRQIFLLAREIFR